MTKEWQKCSKCDKPAFFKGVDGSFACDTKNEPDGLAHAATGVLYLGLNFEIGDIQILPVKRYMYNCTRREAFDYGHRLMNHESLCKNVHGHRGVVELTCAAPKLDEVGRVIDFSEIKRILKGWIDAHWDHAFLCNSEDKVMLEFLKANGQRHYEFPGEPSAEKICHHLAEEMAKAFAPLGITVTHVKFFETENNFTEWHAEELDEEAS